VTLTEEPQPAPPKRRSRRKLVVIALFVLSVPSCLIGYPVVRVRVARDRVNTFCESVVVGAPARFSEMEREATDQGLTVMGPFRRHASNPRTAEPGAERGQEWTAHDGWVFSRCFCNVQVDGGIVSGKDATCMD